MHGLANKRTKNSPKRYRGGGKRWESPGSVNNKSDCWIRNRARLENMMSYLNSYVTSYGKSLFYIYIKTISTLFDGQQEFVW